MLEPDPKLVAAAEAKRAKKRNRAPDAECSKCSATFPSKADVDEHMIDKHPTGVFTPKVQEDYITKILGGMGRWKAARALGVPPGTVARFIDLNPAFDRAVHMAEEEYVERVEARLYEAALEGEPWAVKEALAKRNPKRWGDADKKLVIEHTGTITNELEVGPRAEQLATIEQRLRQRALMAGDVIDVEVIEDV